MIGFPLGVILMRDYGYDDGPNRKRDLVYDSEMGGYMCPQCGRYIKGIRNFGKAKVRYYCEIRDQIFKAEKEFCKECAQKLEQNEDIKEVIEITEPCLDGRVNESVFQ